jgi:hypothetical protein
MPEVEGVSMKLGVEDSEWTRKLDDAIRRVKQLEETTGKAAKSTSKNTGAFLGGAVGGFAGSALGFVSGQVQSSQAFGSILDLFISEVIAGLMPIIERLPEIMEAIGKFLDSPAVKAIINAAAAAAPVASAAINAVPEVLQDTGGVINAAINGPEDKGSGIYETWTDKLFNMLFGSADGRVKYSHSAEEVKSTPGQIMSDMADRWDYTKIPGAPGWHSLHGPDIHGGIG